MTWATWACCHHCHCDDRTGHCAPCVACQQHLARRSPTLDELAAAEMRQHESDCCDPDDLAAVNGRNDG